MIKAGVRHLFVLSLLAVLAVTWWVYAPGLAGGFQFDDFANLPALGASGPVDDWATFWRYITSGVADPTGRPLALLSFLLDAHNWPADPRPFLRTNLILHLVNGALLALLLRTLGRALLSPLPAGEGGPKGRVRVRKPSDAPHSAGPSPQPLSPRERGLLNHWRIDLAAVLGAALWLLHPLLVSTTLYIVQREAMLPATFTLLGLLLWLHGRATLLRGRTLGGWIWIALGLGGCMSLGVLSKANGALLPALALVIEYTVLRAAAPPPARRGGSERAYGNASATATADAVVLRHYRWAMVLLAWLPTVAVAGFLLRTGWNGFVHGVSAVRPWTLGQRLLTEPRVLMDYLTLLWVPRPFTPGLFNDHIFASTSLFSPASTLPALLAVIGLIAGAWLLRKRWPAAALAILFYFVGQSLESSTVALELYFEHRNYLPAMLMFWPVALWLCGVRWRGVRTTGEIVTSRMDDDVSRDVHSREYEETRAEHAATLQSSELEASQSAARDGRSLDYRLRGNDGVDGGDLRGKAKLVLAIVLLLGLGAMTHARASLWGNTHDQALLWAQLNPDSPRAQANAAMTEMQAGNPARAIARLQPLLAREPEQIQLALNLFDAQCAMGQVSPATFRATEIALRTTRNPGTLLARWFGPAIARHAAPTCPQENMAVLQNLLNTAQQNPYLLAVAGRRQELFNLQGRIALIQGKPDVALADFNQALDQNVHATTALQQAALLGSRGYPQRGLAHLNHYDAAAKRPDRHIGFNMPHLHAWVLQHQHYWQTELNRLRDTLRADVAKMHPCAPRRHVPDNHDVPPCCTCGAMVCIRPPVFEQKA